MRKRLLIATAACAVMFFAVMGLPPQLTFSDAALRDYRTLVDARIFEGPAVGVSGETPEVVQALWRLEARPEGTRAFKYALVQGTMPAKLYALIALQQSSPRTFNVAVQPFRIMPGEVPTAFGCAPGVEKTRDVVRDHAMYAAMFFDPQLRKARQSTSSATAR